MKDKRKEKPSNYRNIASVPTLYKITKTVVASKVEHLTERNMLTEELRGVESNVMSALIFDCTILKLVKETSLLVILTIRKLLIQSLISHTDSKKFCSMKTEVKSLQCIAKILVFIDNLEQNKKYTVIHLK